jgi:carboxymethylenebutenolidase
VGAVVDFYGVGGAQPDYSKLQGPVLLIAPELDQGGGPENLGKQAEAIKAAGKQAEMVSYPDANHAFMNDTRPQVYKEDAARDAWSRMVTHLKSNLR